MHILSDAKVEELGTRKGEDEGEEEDERAQVLLSNKE